VLDLGKPFESNEFGDLEQSRIRRLAEIVAQEISIMTSSAISLELVWSSYVSWAIASGDRRSVAECLDGAGLDVRAAEAQEKFGRGRGELEITAVEVSGKWGWRNVLRF